MHILKMFSQKCPALIAICVSVTNPQIQMTYLIELFSNKQENRFEAMWQSEIEISLLCLNTSTYTTALKWFYTFFTAIYLAETL